jgi:DNA repair exonuclease SbcCD ATPase subunit
MATDKTDSAIEEIQEKVDQLSEELASLREDLETLSLVSEMDKKLDDITKSVTGIDSIVKEIEDSKESAVIIKKLDDILVTLADSEGIPKKLDDLQNYIAGLSSLEEQVQNLSGQFEETKEIVGIIVRQLDDIERKYNAALDKVSEAVEMLTTFIQSENDEALESKKPKKPPKEAPPEEKPKVKSVDKANLPSTIDALMDNLMTLVVPQTEATEMAEALEEVRDELTTLIKGHTPVLFQFGKRARELKSYPPTATLNENDIASLSREIKSWKSKLKEMAVSS